MLRDDRGRNQLHAQSGKFQASDELMIADAAQDFVRLYYNKLDKQQFRTISRFYSPEALQVWNGIANSGPEKIQQFLSQLPKTNHTIMSVDAQRIQDNSSENQSFMIQIGGIARFKDNGPKQFFQTLFATMTDTKKYKITLDNYRCLGQTP